MNKKTFKTSIFFLMTLLSSFFLLTSVVTAATLLEEDIGGFTFSSHGGGHVSGPESQDVLKYVDEDGRICRFAIYTYSDKQELRDNIMDDFDFYETEEMQKLGSVVYALGENAFYWISGKNLLFLRTRFTDEGIPSTEYDCDKIMQRYLDMYPFEDIDMQDDLRPVPSDSSQDVDVQAHAVQDNVADVPKDGRWVSAVQEPSEFQKARRQCPDDFDGYDPSYGLEKTDFEEIFEHCYDKPIAEVRPEHKVQVEVRNDTGDPSPYVPDGSGRDVKPEDVKVYIRGETYVPENKRANSSDESPGVETLSSETASGAKKAISENQGNGVLDFLNRFRGMIVSWFD